MLHHIPRTLPSLGDMLADLGRPHPYSLGQALGVDERTARRWIKQGHAPRAAMLALFWVTSWGSSALDASAHNRAMAWRGLAQAQGRELARVQARADAMARALMASGWSSGQDGGVNVGGHRHKIAAYHAQVQEPAAEHHPPRWLPAEHGL